MQLKLYFMRAATIHDLKAELSGLSQKQLLDLCLRLAKFKKENKELLTYLLFEAGNEEGYIESVRLELDDLFEPLPHPNAYLTKKTLRKILRVITRYSRYSNMVQSEIEMRIYFLDSIRKKEIRIAGSQALINMYAQQVKKISALIDTLHEDLQFDYTRRLKDWHNF